MSEKTNEFFLFQLMTQQLNQELAAKLAELGREQDKKTQEMVLELLQDYDKDLKKVFSFRFDHLIHTFSVKS